MSLRGERNEWNNFSYTQNSETGHSWTFFERLKTNSPMAFDLGMVATETFTHYKVVGSMPVVFVLARYRRQENEFWF